MNLENIVELMEIEKIIEAGLSDLELTMRKKWAKLPGIKSNVIYYECPYFDELRALIIDETNILMEAIIRCGNRQQKDIEKALLDFKEKWFNDYNNGTYQIVLQRLTNPYEEAFETVIANNTQKYQEFKRKMAEYKCSSCSGSYGIITNDIAALAVSGAIEAISGTIDEMAHERRAWNNISVPQTRIHTKLSLLWNSEFENGFMNVIENLHKKYKEELLMALCHEYGLTYEEFLEGTQSEMIDEAFNHYKNKIEHEDRHKKEKQIGSYQQEVDRLNEIIKESNKSIAGFFSKQKRAAKRERDMLLNEINILENHVSVDNLQYKFLALMEKYLDALELVNCKGYVEFNEEKGRHCLFTSSHKEICPMNKDFTRTYGRFCKCSVHYEGVSTMPENDRIFIIDARLYQVDNKVTDLDARNY